MKLKQFTIENNPSLTIIFLSQLSTLLDVNALRALEISHYNTTVSSIRSHCFIIVLGQPTMPCFINISWRKKLIITKNRKVFCPRNYRPRLTSQLKTESTALGSKVKSSTERPPVRAWLVYTCPGYQRD